MDKLIKTNLQKIILLIGGFSIFFRLLNVGYYERYNAIFTSIGILILTAVFLIISKDYHPKFHLKTLDFAKKHKRFLIYIVIFVLLILLIWTGWILYENTKEKQITKIEKEKFHNSEVAYQRCLDKVADLTIYEDYDDKILETSKSKFGRFTDEEILKRNRKSINKYFDEWTSVGRPNYNELKGHWEWAFMEWMIKKYPEFCREYDIDLINYFLDKKEEMFLELDLTLPKLP